MQRLGRRVRLVALGLKSAGLIVGIGAVVLALAYGFAELTYLASSRTLGIGDAVVVLAMAALAFSGVALAAQLPESFMARFRRSSAAGRRRPVYGFGTMLAVGIGATLGSPLFILIPENILQYEAVSLVSLLLATILSVAMAKVYSDMYKESKALGLEGVGGPSFTKVAVGTRSVRYFVSRVSMWVGNTALAAYTKIVFLIFVLSPPFLPAILGTYGLSAVESSLVTYSIAGAFIAWTILNILFEQKYLRLLGMLQILMTAALILILLYHSVTLGDVGRWNLAGLFGIPFGLGWLPTLVINTGYLYLLFFGFQEIQSLERDAVDRSSVPLLSWVRRGFSLERTRYFGVAMICSVVVASAINILYGLAVYASHTSLQGSAIPALFLAGSLLGPGQELLVSAAFLIATVTTFVPAFLAASRHLSALAEDGYMPQSLASLSWVFTLVAVLLLAISNQDFLVNVTDFMVLISLGIISLSAIWLGKRPVRVRTTAKRLPLLVGISCFAFGGAVYFLNPTVVVFGTLAVVFAYLAFDIFELGNLGAQLFLSVLGTICAAALALFGHEVYVSGVPLSVTAALGADPGMLLSGGLLLTSALLGANVIFDVGVLGRTSVRQANPRRKPA